MKTPPKLQDLRQVNPRILAPGCDEWPHRLGELGPHKPPSKLYASGRDVDPEARAVAIVGTRRPTAAGIEAAGMLAKGLAEAGFVVVSGLALGIDAAAHRAAIEAGGHTIAVIGCGSDLNYPQKNERLRRQVESVGTVITEYTNGIPPLPHHFPLRNRIIVGLTEGVVVVEGSVKSGALITGRLALDANRAVFAVPGSIRNPYAAGPNELIRCMEATAITEVQHVFDELAPGMVWVERGSPGGAATIDEAEGRVLALLDDVAVTPDFLVAESHLEHGQVLLTLSKLEIRGLARRWNGAYELTGPGAKMRSALRSGGG
ncbi:MAG: DNA-processing protein DprA [Actinomycetota bacterium]